jgi:hypothetical protein
MAGYTVPLGIFNGRMSVIEKHTPGPWAIGLESDDDRFQVIASTGEHICYVELDPVGSNARLIAAAPDLLAALKWAVDCSDMNLDDLDLDTCAALDAARAAIAKAEGRS